jgi:hypothetical protein
MDERRTFVDPKLEAAFLRDGFVVVDLLGPTEVDALLGHHQRLDSGIRSGYYPSFMSRDEGYKAAANLEITDLLWPPFAELLDGYRPLLGVFMVKHPGPDTEVVPHQDWIVADEARRPTMNAWVPLTPVDDDAGRMRVLPGSHRWLEGLRGSPSFPTAWEAAYERVRDELMVTVPIEVGQAMVYDIRVLHGTPANRSDRTRVVSSLYAIPEGADPVHYHRAEDGKVTGYRVAADFCTTFAVGDVPRGEPFVEIPDYAVEALSFEEIAQRCARPPRRGAPLG